MDRVFDRYRIRPQMQAGSIQWLTPESVRLDLEALLQRLPELVDASEPPSPLHGDLWGGNRLIDASGNSWLIDPAFYFGNREVDLAMMKLFGGFDEVVFDAYAEAFPLPAGWRANRALPTLPNVGTPEPLWCELPRLCCQYREALSLIKARADKQCRSLGA